MNQYRLLRSNKESGPYTAAQLIQLGLKPYDLVWLDGRSAAWRYPCEMEEFKAYAPVVEEQPFDRFFKKPGAAKVTSTASFAQAPVQTAAFTATSTAAVKPRIRVRADWNRMEQPPAEPVPQIVAKPVAQPPVRQVEKPIQSVVEQPKAQQQPQPKQAANANTSWTSAWLDWQQEKKAVEHASKTTDDNEANYIRANKPEPEIETKFSQSLTDLKQRYAETILKAKGKTAEWYKYKGLATIILLAIPVLGFGIWLGSRSYAGNDTVTPKPTVNTANVIPVSNTEAAAQQQPIDNSPAAPENTGNSKPAVKKPNTYSKEVIPSFDDEKAESKPAPQPVKKPVPTIPPVHAQPAAVGVAKYAAVNQHQAAPPQYKQPAPPQPAQRQYAFTPPANNDPSARSKVVNPALLGSSANNNAAAYNNNGIQNRQQENDGQATASKKPAENAAPVFSHYSKKQKIEDFVSVEADLSSQQSIQNHLLNVENVADVPLDLVVIDVQYYDAYGKFKTGQTIYVKNIPVNETIIAKIPDNANASRIKFKVSLVSAEQKGVYLVAE